MPTDPRDPQRLRLLERLEAAHERWAYMNGSYGPDGAHVAALAEVVALLRAVPIHPQPGSVEWTPTEEQG